MLVDEDLPRPLAGFIERPPHPIDAAQARSQFLRIAPPETDGHAMLDGAQGLLHHEPSHRAA